MAILGHNLGAFVDDALRGTLKKHSVSIVAVVALDDSGHGLALAAELESGNALDSLHEVLTEDNWVFLVVLHLGGTGTVVEAKLLGENFHSSLGRLTLCLEKFLIFLIDDGGSVVGRADHCKVLEGGARGVLGISETDDLSLRRVGFLLNVVFDDVVTVGANNSESDRAHLILGQGSGLVRADHTGAAESLNRWESSHDAVVCGHLAGSECEASRDDGGQTFGNGGDGESDGNFEIVDASFKERTVDGVRELGVVHHPDKEADNEDDLGEEFTEVVNLLLKRRLALVLLGGLNFSVHCTDGCVHSSVRDDADGAARADDCGREKHVLLVLEHLGALTELFVVLLDRYRLTREGCLLHLEGNRFNFSDTQVSGDTLALLDFDNVTRDNEFGIDGFPGTVAEGEALLCLHLLEGVECTVGVAVLPNGHHGVQDKNQKDHEWFNVGGKALISVT